MRPSGNLEHLDIMTMFLFLERRPPPSKSIQACGRRLGFHEVSIIEDDAASRDAPRSNQQRPTSRRRRNQSRCRVQRRSIRLA